MKRFLSTILFTVFTIGFISLSFGAEPYTWFVDDDNPSETPPWCSSIQQAVDRAYAGNDIMVWPGDYDEEVVINGKEKVHLHAQNPNDKPVLTGKIILGNSRDIVISNVTFTGDEEPIGGYSENSSYGLDIRNCDFTRSTYNNNSRGVSLKYDMNIKGCNFKNYGIAINAFLSSDGSLSDIDIEDCVIEDANIGLYIHTARTAPSNASINAKISNTDFNNCVFDYDKACVYVDSRCEESDPDDDIPITVYLENNTYDINHPAGREYAGIGKNITWIFKNCPICPTSYKTPNYPSNYNNNCNETAILDAPSNSGYTIVINGETEYGNDFLYIREMDGTLIEQLSGAQNNYSILIDSNRPVKVEFVSNSTVTYEGYEVTVESPWTTGINYNVDDVVLYEGAQWVNTYAHTSQADWYPGACGLWFWELLEILPPENWTTNVWYVVGDIVQYNNETWKCTYAHTSQVDWYPGAPGLWFWELQE